MKNLFFAAVLAIVAVGGAFATTNRVALNLYSPGGDIPLDCDGNSTLCSTVLNLSIVYTAPYSSGDQWAGTEITLTAVHKIYP